MSIRTVVFSLLLTLMSNYSWSQYTLTGLQGLINVPEASVQPESTFLFGMQSNAQEYLLVDYNDGGDKDEYISRFTLGFIPRISITMTLARIFGDPDQTVGNRSSIGDRSVQLTFQPIRERKYIPAVVINLTDPFYSTNQYLAGNHIIASKTLWSVEKHELRSTLGYGLPYLLVFQGQENRQLVGKTSDFLTGVFGGVSYKYLPINLQASLEYDGQKLNGGLGYTAWKKLGLQVYTLGFKHLGAGINFTGTIR